MAALASPMAMFAARLRTLHSSSSLSCKGALGGACGHLVRDARETLACIVLVHQHVHRQRREQRLHVLVLMRSLLGVVTVMSLRTSPNTLNGDPMFSLKRIARGARSSFVPFSR